MPAEGEMHQKQAIQARAAQLVIAISLRRSTRPPNRSCWSDRQTGGTSFQSTSQLVKKSDRSGSKGECRHCMAISVWPASMLGRTSKCVRGPRFERNDDMIEGM